METETIDKLFLELSQVTNAKTRRELDMALLIRQLAHALNKKFPDHALAIKAKDYLQRQGLQGSLLRDEPEL